MQHYNRKFQARIIVIEKTSTVLSLKSNLILLTSDQFPANGWSPKSLLVHFLLSVKVWLQPNAFTTLAHRKTQIFLFPEP
jgi:hypothetical protein